MPNNHLNDAQSQTNELSDIIGGICMVSTDDPAIIDTSRKYAAFLALPSETG